MEEFYTYLWLRYDGTPYYVGKGKGNRGFVSCQHSVRRPKDKARIIIEHHLTEDDAFSAEKFLIFYYGRIDIGTGILHNCTDGGEGASGAVRSEEHKAKMSLAQTGKKASAEARAKMSLAQKGRKLSLEHRSKISKTTKGKIISEETKRKIGKSATGRVHSEESKIKMSASMIGKTRSAEARANMSAAHIGKKTKPHSEETKRKISSAQKGKPNFGSHNRWHVNRGFFNSDCELCQSKLLKKGQ